MRPLWAPCPDAASISALLPPSELDAFEFSPLAHGDIDAVSTSRLSPVSDDGLITSPHHALPGPSIPHPIPVARPTKKLKLPADAVPDTPVTAAMRAKSNPTGSPGDSHRIISEQARALESDQNVSSCACTYAHFICLCVGDAACCVFWRPCSACCTASEEFRTTFGPLPRSLMIFCTFMERWVLWCCVQSHVCDGGRGMLCGHVNVGSVEW